MSISAAQSVLTIAVVGNPNTGKSTLFNALAGARARVGNFPGVTVERKVASLRLGEQAIQLVDLPGTYSLAPRSLDEMVAVDVLLGRQAGLAKVDLVLCVVDAANLERNLYLVSQLLELGVPVVVALNMWDVARTRQLSIDVQKLSERLGVPVVPTSAHRRMGLQPLRQAMLEASQRPGPTPHTPLPSAFEQEVERAREFLGSLEHGDTPVFLVRRWLLDVGGYIEQHWKQRHRRQMAEYLQAARQRLGERGCSVPAVEARTRYAWIRQQLAGVLTRPAVAAESLSDRLDRVLTHRIWGLALFALVMFLVFQSIFQWATGLMDGIDWGKQWVAAAVTGVMSPGPLRSLLVDGAIEGVGSVVVFLPQIAILFLFIAVLEDCGYMSRAAFLMDRWLSRIGLSGKSFVPLMSSFACAVPGIMATRVIENRRDRMVTILVAPLMSCSARLPVYLLFIAAFVPSTAYANGWISLQGLVLLAMYLLGLLVAIPVALVLNRWVFPGERAPFVMELPSYKWPSASVVARRVVDRCWTFLARAGTLIFATVVVVWALANYPADRSELYRLQAQLEAAAEPAAAEPLDVQINALRGQLIAESFLGRMGHAIEPVVQPLGWDWRIGVAVLASFPAREVVIGTLGTIFSLGSDVEEEIRLGPDAGAQAGGLRGALAEARWPSGAPLITLPVAVSIMVFFALCAQCGATLMVIRRETNSWLWPVVTFGYMTLLAYVGALGTYQVGRWLAG